MPVSSPQNSRITGIQFESQWTILKGSNYYFFKYNFIFLNQTTNTKFRGKCPLHVLF